MPNPTREIDARDVELSEIAAAGHVPRTLKGGEEKQEKLEIESERQKWGSSIEFWLTLIGYCVGFGNLWRFPYLAYTYGGGAFLVPYFISLFCIGVPLFLCETALGQFMQKGPVGAFKAINPKLQGVGVAQVILCFTLAVYYDMLVAWSLIFFLYSWGTPLAWSENPDDNNGKSWDDNFFVDTVLNRSEDINETTELVWPLFFCDILGHLLIYACIYKGIQSSGKASYILSPLPYILLLCFLLRAFTLPGIGDGLKYLFIPKFDLLFNIDVWRAAASQIVFSTSVGLGPTIAFSSYRQKTEPVKKSSVGVCLINSASSLFCSALIFSVLGYMAYEQGVSIEDLEFDGPRLAFEVFPAALTLMPGSNFWALIFFLTLISLGLTSAFAQIENIGTCLSDWGLVYQGKPVPKYMLNGGLIAIVFLGSLIFATNAGYWWLELFDRYALPIPLMLCCFMEALGMGWSYDIEKLDEHFIEYNGKSVGPYFKFMIKYVCPVIIGLMIIISLISEILNPLPDYPAWSIAFGWLLMIIPMATIVYFAAKSYTDEKNKDKINEPDEDDGSPDSTSKFEE